MRVAKIIEAAFERDGYEIVDVPGSGVLRLHVELIDLKINEPPTAENLGSDVDRRSSQSRRLAAHRRDQSGSGVRQGEY